ncbi:MAG: TIGR03618 family F420-dependent PPOX class oxidoreductase [Anaerolineales bacterium]
MSVSIPERMADLFAWETKAFAFLGLVRKDGRPHVTPVWFDYRDERIVINTARGRVKDKILKRRGPVTMAILDPNSPYRYFMLEGRVVEETEEGAFDQIQKLNEKYHGKYEYPKRPGEVRVTYRIEPTSVFPRK